LYTIETGSNKEGEKREEFLFLAVLAIALVDFMCLWPTDWACPMDYINFTKEAEEEYIFSQIVAVRLAVPAFWKLT